MFDVHVIICILCLPILLLSIIRVHDLDSLWPLNLFLLNLRFTFFWLNLFCDRMAKIQVLDLCKHKGRQIVRVLTVARAVLRIKPVAATNNTKYLHVFRQ